MTLRALVCGYGSIGRRHAEVIAGLGVDCRIVSRRDLVDRLRYCDLGHALRDWNPDYVVVANETAAHAGTLKALADADFGGIVLVEKPLAMTGEPMPSNSFARLGVGYQLRFHPLIAALREAIGEGAALSVDASVGQWLPEWRIGRDYTMSYSASEAAGGGVLRDLSHEIDLLIWLFGPPRRVAAIGGKVSDLAITSDDVWSVLMQLDRCPVASLHLDYLHRPKLRQLCVNHAHGTAVVDLVAGTLTVNGRSETHRCTPDAPLRAMHKAMLAGEMRNICDGTNGQAVDECIAAIEKAGRNMTWVWP